MKLSGNGEGEQVIAARQESGLLLGDPALSLVLVTLWAAAIAAGVIGVDLPVAVVALVKMASKERRSAVRDIGQSLFLNRRQSLCPLLAKRFTVEADNVGHLRHRPPDQRPCIS
jgi:hypothetical protein